MKHFKGGLHFLAGGVVVLLLLAQFAFRDSEFAFKDPEKESGLVWRVPDMPETISFAGEAAPVKRWDVREKFEKEFLNIYYSPGNIIYLLKLANRNFPVISERLKANGVPDDFKYLCIAESNMQSWAVSRSGAVGYWQFLSGTAPGYGLETSASVDERQHLEKSTDAACRYLKQAYARFGNWTAAAASYNCGMGGYASQAGFQRTNNYYDLNLPEETNKYILRILSFKYLMENADQLGFVVKDAEKYPDIPVRHVTVTSTIPDLAQFAISNGTTYKMLRVLNPWLKGKSLPVSRGKTYVVSLPANR
ncbi:MAG TPA: lytic transglycosylase domain-containing protein [Flavisolibacter sp.]